MVNKENKINFDNIKIDYEKLKKASNFAAKKNYLKKLKKNGFDKFQALDNQTPSPLRHSTLVPRL